MREISKEIAHERIEAFQCKSVDTIIQVDGIVSIFDINEHSNILELVPRDGKVRYYDVDKKDLIFYNLT